LFSANVFDSGTVLWLSAISLRVAPQIFDTIDKDIPVFAKFISNQTNPLIALSAVQSNKSIYPFVLRVLPFLAAISILLQLRSTIFHAKVKVSLHFAVAGAATALLIWASQSYGQFKLADKAKDVKAASAFWRETLTLFTHVLEALSMLAQAETGGWTLSSSQQSNAVSPFKVSISSVAFDVHVFLRVLYRAFDLAIFVFEPKSAAILKSSNLIPILKLNTVRHLVAVFLMFVPPSYILQSLFTV
jgi:hypothetical protein